MTITINDVNVKITFNNKNNCYIGEFININKPNVYGDSVNEVISQIEEIINEGEK